MRHGRPTKQRPSAPTDAEILDAIRLCWSRQGQPPTPERLGALLRYSERSIRRRIAALVDAGILRRATPYAPPVIVGE